MYLAHLRARCFRNLLDAELLPGSGVCVLYGENAQGKTNLIEAIYLLSNLHSFRTRRIGELIASRFDSSLVQGDVVGTSGRDRLEVTLEPGRRSARLNGKGPRNTSSYLSAFHTVLFSPLDLDLARGNQEMRRRFLDRATFLRDSSHLSRIRRYNRVLKQRNAQLRVGKTGLQVWDEKLAEAGSVVHAARRATLSELGPVIDDIQREISGGSESLDIAWCVPYATEKSVTDGLRRGLREGLEKDLRRGYTGTGPHRDALIVRLGGRIMERHASQGQLRTLALSFKLALLIWGCKVMRQDPVFLLDDPGAELDAKRLTYLGDFLGRWSGQVVIAGTSKNSVPAARDKEHRYYRVEAGRLAEG